MSRFVRKHLQPTLIAAATVALFAASAVQAVSRQGAEYPLHTVTAGAQAQPSLAAATDGRHVAAWTGTDGSGTGIRAQRFDAAGAPVGGEFVVNTTTEFDQFSPVVAMAADGSFVIAWESRLGGANAVFARRFDAAGTALGNDFTVEAGPSTHQTDPAIAMHGSGAFVVTWVGSSGSVYDDIFAQRFDATGTRLGSVFRVNTYTTNRQATPTVAMDAAGRFLVAWASLRQDGGEYGVYGQRYDAAGGLAGSEFRINEITEPSQDEPSIAMAADGSFAVAWKSHRWNFNLNFGDLYARRFDASAAPLGGEFRVSVTNPFTHQRLPAAVADASGGFVVTWTGGNQDEYGDGLFGRRYDASGTGDGGEFRINTSGIGHQSVQSIASLPGGEFLVGWQSDGQDGDSSGVYAQRFFIDAHGGAPVLTISGPISVTEGDAATYTAHLSAAPETDASARVRTEGSAIAGTDYTALPAVVTLPAGLTDTALATIQTARDCDYFEDDYIHLQASQPADGSIALGEPNRVTLRLVESLRLGMAAAGGGVAEGGSRRVYVVLSTALLCNATVRYGLAGGRARLDVDYTASTPRRVVIPAGTTQFELVRLSTIDDVLDENDETVIVTLRSFIYDDRWLDPAALTYTLTIRDND